MSRVTLYGLPDPVYPWLKKKKLYYWRTKSLTASTQKTAFQMSELLNLFNQDRGDSGKLLAVGVLFKRNTEGRSTPPHMIASKLSKV